MKFVKSTIALAIVAVVSGSYALADDLDVIEVVSDNYSPQTQNVAAKGVVKVRQATKMSDVLRGVPGVNVNGARSVVERYNIRGVSEEYLSVTVDGARQNGYSFHHNGNYGIDPEILKKVDIDVGANSVVTAAGSLGGSIKFETVDAADLLEQGEKFGGKVKYAWGSNGNSHQTMATLFGKIDHFDLLGYFNYRHQLDGKDGNGTKNANKGHLQDYLFKAKYNFGENHWFKLSAEHYTNTAFSCSRANMAFCTDEYIGKRNYSPERKYTTLERETYTAAYAYNPGDNPWVNLKANAYSTATKATSLGSPKSRVKTVGGTVSNKSEFDLGLTHHFVTIGGEYYKTTAQKLGSNVSDARLTSTSIYLEDQIGIGNFTIIPGIRYDYYTAKLSDNFNKNYDRFSKALGLRYALTDNLALFANYTELFKGPDAGEIVLRGTGRLSYDANLEATKGDNKEAGFSYTRDGLFTHNDDLSFTAKYFHTNYDNISQSVANSVGRGSVYKNLGAVVLKGVELSTRYNIENFSTLLTYARARSKQKDTGYAVFPDSGDRYTISFNYALPEYGVQMGWSTMWVRGLTVHSSATSITTKQEYAVSNAYVSWVPQQYKNVELIFGIDNIFNKAYKDHSTQYYNAVDYDPGRNYKLSVSYRF
ncbi:TonB-dependent receptor [Pasteurellaceae bacterium LIM206]|nr:TonB-dependent receptor [Pasteurellaceae bacterium LIM206]